MSLAEPWGALESVAERALESAREASGALQSAGEEGEAYKALHQVARPPLLPSMISLFFRCVGVCVNLWTGSHGATEGLIV